MFQKKKIQIFSLNNTNLIFKMLPSTLRKAVETRILRSLAKCLLFLEQDLLGALVRRFSGKELSFQWRRHGSIPGREDCLEKEIAIMARKIPWTEELGRLQFMGLQRIRHDWMHTRIVHFNFHLYSQVISFLLLTLF